MYHDINNQLPAGWMGYDPSTGLQHWFGLPGWGWCARILPYMEQGAAYQNVVHFNLPITDSSNAEARVYPINTFHCPSDVGEKTFTLQGGGPFVGPGSFSPVELATGNYIGMFGTIDIHVACPGTNGQCEGNGSFFLNRGVRFADITDGLSNTLIVGERCSKLAPSTWVGVVTGGQHGPARVVGVATYPPNSEAEAVHYFHNFSSFHPAGTQFLSADGSVRLIAQTINATTYQALATRSGNEVVGNY